MLPISSIYLLFSQLPICNQWLLPGSLLQASAFSWAPSLHSALLAWAAPPVKLSLVAWSPSSWDCEPSTLTLCPESSHSEFGAEFSRRKERSKVGRLFPLKSGSFDFFLKVYYTFWCPRKILLWDIHSTKHFHQGVLLLFLVKRFKNPTWTEKLHWYLWKNKIRMLFIAFPTRKSNCLGIHPS